MNETMLQRVIPIAVAPLEEVVEDALSLAVPVPEEPPMAAGVEIIPIHRAPGAARGNAASLQASFDFGAEIDDPVQQALAKMNPNADGALRAEVTALLTTDWSGEFPTDTEMMVQRAESTIMKMLIDRRPVCVAWSAGKDSSVCLNLVLSAASKLSQVGIAMPPIAVTHADTSIENPEVLAYAQAEKSKIEEFARRYRLDVRVETSTPNLVDQWSVRIIGGRALPPHPTTNHDCTTDWKIRPMDRLRNEIMRDWSKKNYGMPLGEPVILIGTRFDESAERRRNMTERGESDIVLRRGVDEDGNPTNLFLSPIAFWTTDDVWLYLQDPSLTKGRQYSDFAETLRIYSAAMGECAAVADALGKGKQNSKACGARHGCSLCTAVGIDKSMENMLREDRYKYMEGLNKLQKFIVHTYGDLSRRNWVGRTIVDNHLVIAPDAYSPKMMEELLKYALTIDIREKEAASRLGIAPRFSLVNMEQLVAIDAMWSLQAYHRPFHALAIYRDIYEDGRRYPVPDVSPAPVSKIPEPRYIPVTGWDEAQENAYTGLRDVMMDLVRGEGPGCMGNRVLKNGAEVLAMEVSSSFKVDLEGADMLFQFMFDEMMEKHDDPRTSPLEGYRYYARHGTISVSTAYQAKIDSIMRRSSFKIRNGLDGQQDPQALLARSLSAAEAGIVREKKQKKVKAGAKAALPPSKVNGAVGSTAEQLARATAALALVEDGPSAGAAPRAPKRI